MISPGPFAAVVTQHVAGVPSQDSHGNDVSAFSDVSVQALAVYPGNMMETDDNSQDTVMADVVVLLPPSVVVSAYDEFSPGDGFRYRCQGEPGRYMSPFTGTAVTQVNLRRIT